MGVDLVGIIGHSMSKKELVDLPNRLNDWSDVKEFYSSYSNQSMKEAKWDGDIDEEQLELIWLHDEGRLVDKVMLSKMQHFYSDISCSFGSLVVCRRTILITHWNHKYDNLRNPQTAKNILTLNRLVAKHFNQKEIIYCADSAYPTQIIEQEALSGLGLKDIKTFAIHKFGMPPASLNEGRKYMFFIDDFTEDLNNLTQWESGGDNNPYWYYDAEQKDYVLQKHISVERSVTEKEISEKDQNSSYKKEFFDILNNYEKGLITKEELFSQLCFLNQNFYKDYKQKNENYFTGGTAKDLTKE